MMKKQYLILIFLLIIAPACNFLVPPAPTPIPTSTLIPTPTLGVGSSMVGEDGMTLLYVPAGEFTMGSNISRDEQPMHQVYLDAFWIDETEVTNNQYAVCVGSGVCVLPSLAESNLKNFEFKDHPVVFVDWYSAKKYCEWVGRRLPTEAEWEKASRGTHADTYPWGDEMPDGSYVNYGFETVKVGLYPKGASVYGVLETVSNVFEWVNSLYQPYPYYPNDGRENPISSEFRVVRGDSFHNYAEVYPSSHRIRYDPTTSKPNLGFRCAVSQ